MSEFEINPTAFALLQSLRGLGYSPETALADLIDNSIAAGSTRIDLNLDWNGGDPIVELLDDGAGLSFEELIKAMRFGGDGPHSVREPDDLGRFGLGLKTASLSQCRQLTVISKKGDIRSCIAWDVDVVMDSKRWTPLVDPASFDSNYSECLNKAAHGTLIRWSRMDALGGLFGLDKSSFFARVGDIRRHLGMVFHRFLDGDARRLTIFVCGRRIQAWDPFQTSHPATIRMPREKLRQAGATIVVQPYVLPHRDRFEDEESYAAAGGIGGWTERQGFYVYRGKRLVVSGGWLALGGTRAWTRNEASRLARIAIDLPTDRDTDWRLDIRKSIARPPADIKARLAAIANACRARAREVFSWRGGGGRRQRQGSSEPLWIAEYRGARVRYRINREHPAITTLVAAMKDGESALTVTLSLIECSVPVERIWLDVAERADQSQGYVPDDIDQLSQDIAQLIRAMKGDDTDQEKVDRLLSSLAVDSTQVRSAVIQILGAKL